MSFRKKFGHRPDSNAKKYFSTLSNYRNGQFQNQLHTPSLAEDSSMFWLFRDFLRKDPKRQPTLALPVVKTDLKALPPDKNLLIWFGHSSYYLQVDGLRLLVDPVFSNRASPIPGSVNAFPCTYNYQVTDLPKIDILLITHDHWDHLDYPSILQLKSRVRQVVCGLGVGSHFRYWGYNPSIIIEKNWYESFETAGIKITLTPARHFSGRGLKRNISLWTSYVLKTPSKNIFLGGDSGYGPHFKEIGDQWGPFDWAVMESGQYNKNWPFIHSRPEEVIREVRDLRATNFIPVHHSRFRLAQHPWYEPLVKLSLLAAAEGILITTPRMGEPVLLDEQPPGWEQWWLPFLPEEG